MKHFWIRLFELDRNFDLFQEVNCILLFHWKISITYLYLLYCSQWIFLQRNRAFVMLISNDICRKNIIIRLMMTPLTRTKLMSVGFDDSKQSCYLLLFLQALYATNYMGITSFVNRTTQTAKRVNLAWIKNFGVVNFDLSQYYCVMLSFAFLRYNTLSVVTYFWYTLSLTFFFRVFYV